MGGMGNMSTLYERDNRRQHRLRVAGNIALALGAAAVAAILVWVFVLG
jgi:hypothetical protein